VFPLTSLTADEYRIVCGSVAIGAGVVGIVLHKPYARFSGAHNRWLGFKTTEREARLNVVVASVAMIAMGIAILAGFGQ
jgi:hypothetical protein